MLGYKPGSFDAWVAEHDAHATEEDKFWRRVFTGLFTELIQEADERRGET
jgi:hypothetical protein